MFSRIFRFFFPAKPLTKFRVLDRRDRIPPIREPVLQEFVVEGKNQCEAARKVDNTKTNWTRLTVTEVQS